MPEPGRSVPTAFWLLLPVVVALPVGWWLGNLPVPDPPPRSVRIVAAAAPREPQGPPPSATAPQVTTLDPGSGADQPGEQRTDRLERSAWTSSLDGALAESRRNGKPILIDFSADWCGPCQRLRHEVFEDVRRAATLETAVIPVSIVDQRREAGSNPADIEALQNRYQVEAFPTLVVFSPATGRTESIRGFRGADETLAWITEAARSVR